MKRPTASSLREALATRVVIADGAMGTMLQASQPSLDDFQGHEGCNEILNITRPDIVAGVHQEYLAVGVDAIETNTFGANLANLAEYGIADRIYELAHAGASIARDVASSYGDRWVIGSIGPGTKLPSLGHVDYRTLRDNYEVQCRGLLEGGVDALLIETAQDLLQAKAAINGARAALRATGMDAVLMAQVTVETTGTMLLGTEIGAALTSLQTLGIESIGLNCATGPTEMSEHLRTLSKQSRVGLSVMPNAGLPELTADGAYYPLSPDELAEALATFVREYGVGLVGGCCGTTPAHLQRVVQRLQGAPVQLRHPENEASVASLYQQVPLRQQQTFMAIGERTNANGSKAFRAALLAEDWEAGLEIARAQIRDGAHALDLCIDYVGRDGVADIREFASRLATASTLPVVIDSTEPEVIAEGLSHFGGRSIVNSVNYEDGDGPNSRIAKIMPHVLEHGAAVVALAIDEEGQARTTDWKVNVADRLIKDLSNRWGMRVEDILIDMLTFPIATGQEETRRDGIETLLAIKRIKELHPSVQTTLGVSNISFGLNPAARQVLNSVFLHEAVEHGLDSAIVHASKILPLARISDEHRALALDLIYDRRTFDTDGRCTYDPLTELLDAFAGVSGQNSGRDRAAELAALPLEARLTQRIIDGERTGLEVDLEEALRRPIAPLAIINDHLLEGMKRVGELFGSGEMQLPFVLQSAEVMKAAVAFLEPHMDRADAQGRGTMVLATVKGDVHDIGKNLVDIILTNNGYTVINLGIKQPVNSIIEAALHHEADAIGMSGLLVKSTVIMKENLEEITSRGLADRWPIVLGGAALTRAYVEQDLAASFPGQVRYARDAFEGLKLMDTIMTIKRGDSAVALPPLRERRVRSATPEINPEERTGRSDVASDIPTPTVPFMGSRVIKGIALSEYVGMLDERALFMGQWGLKGVRGGPTFEEMVESQGRPRARDLLNRLSTENLLQAAVVYGYFPCWSDGNDLVVAHHDGSHKGQERVRFSFPRQRRDRQLCISDFFKSKDAGGDVVAFHVVTMGKAIGQKANELFSEDRYREYLELHGLSVQLTEALAEAWHGRVRSEMGFSQSDATGVDGILNQEYRGSRYSFGYPACPDLEMQTQLFELLDPSRIDVELSEEFQLHPEQSTSAIICHHPEAKYFNAL
jgi:5-methyltetrahydrofolate--homocysteine methyltransferase